LKSGELKVSLIAKGINKFDQERRQKEALDSQKTEAKNQLNAELAPLVEKEVDAFNDIGFSYLLTEDGIGFFALEDKKQESPVAVIGATSNSMPYLLSCQSKIKSFATVEDLFDELGYALRSVASGEGYGTVRLWEKNA
jgi:hypothetical protein